MTTILRGSDNFDTGTDVYADSDALTLFNAGGSAPVYACRAWVNFNGTGTVAIRSSGNVSSITDNGAGDYTVNFTNAMPDANYSIIGMPSNTINNWVSEYVGASRGVVGVHQSQDAPTTSAVRVETRYGSSASSNGVQIDFSQLTLAIFR